MAADIARVVALGASNLTRGFQTVVSSARAAWGPEVQVLAALGHGRSYGAQSRVLIRTLPGILESGLWRRLESLPELPTRALITDVGNDLLYGFSAEQLLEWIRETLNRLLDVTQDIILTDLPLASIRRLSRTGFAAFRSMLFPSCRLSLDQVLGAVERVNSGIDKLASIPEVRLFRLRPEWYGLDPIHIRPSLWRPAWQLILDAPASAEKGVGSFLEGARLYLMPPERRKLFGFEQFTAQEGVTLRAGGRVWLY